jgi:hypothetical protein
MQPMRLAVGARYSNGRTKGPVLLSQHNGETAAATMCAGMFPRHRCLLGVDVCRLGQPRLNAGTANS